MGTSTDAGAVGRPGRRSGARLHSEPWSIPKNHALGCCVRPSASFRLSRATQNCAVFTAASTPGAGLATS
jgi:hypothetical protein